MGSLESQMKNMKEEMSRISVTGSAGAGLVQVTINGEYQVQSISISDTIINDKSTIEVLVSSAFNDATGKIKMEMERMAREKASLLGLA